jgi:uncharacterized protein YbjT (DUF2867 family)
VTKLLVIGATGLVGNEVVEQAIADPRVSQIIALTRRPIKARGRLENVVVDFGDLPEEGAWWSVNAVVSALGTTRAAAGSRAGYRAVDYDYPLAVARHARAHGAARFALVSSLGANPRSRFAYARTKGELELEVSKLGFHSLTIVRPSVLGGSREQRRPEERAAQIAVKALARLLPRRLRLSPASAVAALLLDGALEAAPGVHLKTNKDMP